MSFPRDKVSKLLAECHRRCCICHRYCGVKMETDHIVPREDGGDDSIENAIPVCFECHAEIHSYNDKHPRGRKFQPEELRLHKSQWLEICKEHPGELLASNRTVDVGPLQALIDELEFNAKIATLTAERNQDCKFSDQQFLRAIHQGSIAILREDIKNAVLDAYASMAAANTVTKGAWLETAGIAIEEAQRRIREAKPKIKPARDLLLSFLSSEEEKKA